MKVRPHPPYTADAWKTLASSAAVSERDHQRGEQMTHDAYTDHDYGHDPGSHPFCLRCEILDMAEASGKTEDEAYDLWSGDAGENVASRAERWLLLYRNPPRPVEVDTRLCPPFDDGTLAELLARPAEPPARVEDLIPWEAGTLLTAMRKTGKTTFSLNLTKSLVTGEDLLGRFGVRPLDGNVGLLNYEVSAATVARWADEHGIDQHRLYVVNLRGRRNPLTHPEDRDVLVERMKAHDVEALIVDPFGRAYSGKSQNDPGEVGAWLADLDRFARGEVGAKDLILTAHAGWNGERTRGSSALEDWADSIITLTRDAEDDSQRFLRAIGRDVELDEDRLDFDPLTRRLTLAGVGSRKQAHAARHLEDLLPAVLRVVETSPAITGNGLDNALREAGEANFRRGDGTKTAMLGVARGLLRVEHGPRNSRQFFPVDSGEVTSPDKDAGQPLPRTSPRLPQGTQTPPPPPPLYGEVGGGEVKCAACRFPLDPAITADGFTTHPTCQEAS